MKYVSFYRLSQFKINCIWIFFSPINHFLQNYNIDKNSHLQLCYSIVIYHWPPRCVSLIRSVAWSSAVVNVTSDYMGKVIRKITWNLNCIPITLYKTRRTLWVITVTRVHTWENYRLSVHILVPLLLFPWI